jgi:hypothetical protein
LLLRVSFRRSKQSYRGFLRFFCLLH